jgi:hypothetical protein
MFLQMMMMIMMIDTMVIIALKINIMLRINGIDSLPQSIFNSMIYLSSYLFISTSPSTYLSLYCTNNIWSSHVIGQNLSLIFIPVSLIEAKESSAFDLSTTILSNLTCLFIAIDYRWHFKMILLHMMMMIMSIKIKHC